VDISEKIKPHELEKLPWRWIVERTPSWLGHSRRLAKDSEEGKRMPAFDSIDFCVINL
jgi:transposase